jgi:hypothetical protein
MAAYLTLAEFRVRTIMPGAEVDRIESVLAPGWLDAELEASSRWVDMRLSKRYRVPFSSPYSEAVRSWVTRRVTSRAYLVHGIPATDAQLTLIVDDAQKAEDEVKEAADGNLGLIDLSPADLAESRVQRGFTFGYAEASPYVGPDVQRRRARQEDGSGWGTGSGGSLP